MRKTLIVADRSPPSALESGWLDLEPLVDLEFTSEDGAHPVEGALLLSRSEGWRAASPGRQSIRLLFHTPQHVRRIHLEFVEPTESRTQEFAIRWSPDYGQTQRDVVRQQWNFDPRGATVETEDYHVDLHGVTWLELDITPDIGGGSAHASLARWRIAD